MLATVLYVRNIRLFVWCPVYIPSQPSAHSQPTCFVGKRGSFDAVSTAKTLVQVWKRGATGVAVKELNFNPARTRTDPKSTGPVAK